MHLKCNNLYIFALFEMIDPEDGSRTRLRNLGNYLPVDKTLLLRILWPSSAPLCEIKIPQFPFTFFSCLRNFSTTTVFYVVSNLTQFKLTSPIYISVANDITFCFQEKTKLILVTKEHLSKSFVVKISVLAVVLFLTAQTRDVLMSLNLLRTFFCTKWIISLAERLWALWRD